MEENIIDISKLTEEEQKNFLKLCYDKCKNLMNDNTKWNKIAFISDTHGDFLAELISLLESGIIQIQPDKYDYYSINHNKFLKDIDKNKYNYNNNEDIKKIKDIFDNIEKKLSKILVITTLYYRDYINFNDKYLYFENIFNSVSKYDKDLAEEIKNFYSNKIKEELHDILSPEDIFTLKKFFEFENFQNNTNNLFLEIDQFFKKNEININSYDLQIIYNCVIKYDFAIIPTPFINEKYTGQFYHLGDIVDRGRESLTSILFLEKICDTYKSAYPNKDLPIHIVVGNHEADNCGLTNGAEAYELYKAVIARMLDKKYMSSGYLIKNKSNQILVSHSVFFQEDVIMLFVSFFLIDNYNYEYLKELIKQELYNNQKIFKKLNNFVLNKYKKFFVKLIFNNNTYEIRNISQHIKDNFSIEELIKIRIAMLNAILKVNIQNGKISKDGFIASHFRIDISQEDPEQYFVLMSNLYNCNQPIGFWTRIFYKNNDIAYNNVVCDQCIGHEINFLSSIIYKTKGMFNNENIVVDFDVCRSYNICYSTSSIEKIDQINSKDIKIFNDNFFTKALTTYYNVENEFINLSNIYAQSLYIIQRSLNQHVRLDQNSILIPYDSYTFYCAGKDFDILQYNKYENNTKTRYKINNEPFNIIDKKRTLSCEITNDIKNNNDNLHTDNDIELDNEKSTNNYYQNKITTENKTKTVNQNIK